MSWDFNLLTHRQFPRQFELHPSKEELVFGTIAGHVYHAAFADGAASAQVRNLGHFGDGKLDSILGLCWLRRDASRFVAGSSRGAIVCGDTRDGVNGELPGRAPAAVAVYPSFDKLTSVHVNSQNNFLVASGYTTSVRVYDLETATVLHDYDGIHTNHINISRFANHAPFVFSTSSFDGTCKTFDLRMKPTEGGIYTCKCGSGVVRLSLPVPLYVFPSVVDNARCCCRTQVMISYSPDDTFLLASALDNEITQFLALDGRRHSTFEVLPLCLCLLSPVSLSLLTHSTFEVSCLCLLSPASPSPRIHVLTPLS